MLTLVLRRLAFLAALALVAAPATVAAQEPIEETVRETHGDWEIRCAAEDCAMVQALINSDGNTVLVVSITKLPAPRTNDDGAVVVGVARILTPLNVQLLDGLGLRIDDGPPRSAPFIVCSAVGCLSRPPLTADLVDELKAGGVAEFLTAIATPEGRRVVVSPISLRGFTAAYDAL